MNCEFTGWCYRDVLPYFMKSEDIQIPELKDSPYHGRGGYVQVEKYRYYSLITDKFLEAGQEMGYPIQDINGANQFGFSKSHGTLRDGLRCSTAKAFLRPLKKKKNLHIILHSHVEKIMIEDTRCGKVATGVSFKKKGIFHRIVKAKKEVIVSAGAVQSPQVIYNSQNSFRFTHYFSFKFTKLH